MSRPRRRTSKSAAAPSSKLNESRMKKKDEHLIGLDKAGAPIIDPAPDKPPTWEDTLAGKATYRGGNWGMLVGFSVAYAYASFRHPFFFGGEDVAMLTLLLCGSGAGYLIGAALAWFIVNKTGKDRIPPTSFMDSL